MIGILPCGLGHMVLNVAAPTLQKLELIRSSLPCFGLTKQKNSLCLTWFMKCCTMPNWTCWDSSWGMLEYKRWCWLTEKGQTDIVTHTTNIWNKVSEANRLRQGHFFPQWLNNWIIHKCTSLMLNWPLKSDVLMILHISLKTIFVRRVNQAAWLFQNKLARLSAALCCHRR